MSTIRRPTLNQGFQQALRTLTAQDRALMTDAELIRANQDWKESRVDVGNSSGTYIDWTVFSIQDGYTIWGHVEPTGMVQHQERSVLAVDDLTGDPAMHYENRGAAHTLATTAFGAAVVNSGTGFQDHTAEAATDLGVEFPVMESPLSGGTFRSGTGFYVGFAGAGNFFQRIAIDVQTPGSNYNLIAQYYDSAIGAWTTGTTPILKKDNTSGFSRRGTLDLDVPTATWAQAPVNGTSGTWIWIATTSTVTQQAKLYSARPASGIQDLLNLSATQLNQRELAWSSFGGYIYATIPNEGPGSREGQTFIKSGSTATLRRSFFAGFNRHFYTHRSSVTADVPAFNSGSADFYSFWTNDAEADPLGAGSASIFLLTGIGDPWVRLGCRSGSSYNYIDMISTEEP